MIEPVPKGIHEYTHAFDEYLVQVKHDFRGLEEQGCRIISSNFLKLENGGAFHDGDLVVEELFNILQVRNMSFTVHVKEELLLQSNQNKVNCQPLSSWLVVLVLLLSGLTLSISTENAKIARHIYELFFTFTR